MSEPYIGEIRMAGFNFAPQGWAFCDGSIISIAQNDALFNLIGTTYGGDGVNTFGLPNLLGRIPIHMGSGNVIGQNAGTETVTLNTQQMPSHTHALQASSAAATSISPSGTTLATTNVPVYGPASSIVTTGDVTSIVGGNQLHDNIMPSLCVNFIIALYGIYPSQN